VLIFFFFFFFFFGGFLSRFSLLLETEKQDH